MADLNALNEYGVPLHACNGYRLDEHYWVWVGVNTKMLAAQGDPFYLWVLGLNGDQVHEPQPPQNSNLRDHYRNLGSRG